MYTIMIMEVKKPTSDDITSLIDIISHIQEKFSEIGEKTGDTIIAFQNNKMLETFKNVLFFAWEKYKYGWHSDFWEEGDSMIDYMMFEVNAENIISDLISVLKTKSPFELLERNGAITNGLLSVYQSLQTDIKQGEIKV